MNDFKLCTNGHYYQKSLSECPYCPQNNLVQNDDLNITKIQSHTPQNMSNDLNQTKIITSQDEKNTSTSSQRRLVGWLVSFVIDPLGKDFKLYEGRNVLGSDKSCDIVVSGDGAISAKHLTILFRMDVFKFKDELSTNGTFVNDEFAEEGNLQDGDLIRIGQTTFRFKSALQ